MLTAANKQHGRIHVSTQDVQLLPNQVVSEQQSLVVIKKLLAIGVSGITYLRGLFPEKAYGSKYVEGETPRTSPHQLYWPETCLRNMSPFSIQTRK